MIMGFVVFAVVMALALLFCLCGGRETIGDCIIKLFPKAPTKKGDSVNVFLDGSFNRTAIVSGITQDKVMLYDNKVSLPLSYRGRFYGVGVDSNDGSKLVYVANRKHYRFVRVAELIRKTFNVMDDADNLVAEETQEEQQIKEGTTSEEEADNEV